MATAKNIDELKSLIETYETISLEDIKKVWSSIFNKKNKKSDYPGRDVAKNITGFGTFSCILCVKVKKQCHYCVYGEYIGCILFSHKETYKNISEAKTSKQLYNAFRKRAKHLREYFNDIL
ncbi:MAG TPA: hypothetical protein PLD95_02110 [bacterium]|nr:hypothetical protein [bacterium]